MGEAERGDAAPRRRVAFFCAKGHETRPSFAEDAAIPDVWDCPRCGWPAGRDRHDPPAPPKTEPYKTHLAYVRERRSERRRRGDPGRGPGQAARRLLTFR